MENLKRKQVKNNEERLLVIGMITSTKFCQRIIPILDLTLVKSEFIKIIIQWCLTYFKKYKSAPNKNIQQIFEDNKDNQDDEVNELIKNFLISISDEYNKQNYNDQYVFDKVSDYIRKLKLDKISKELKLARDNGEIEFAEELIQNYKSVKAEEWDFADVFDDASNILKDQEDDSNFLFRFPGDFGDMLGDLCRAYLFSWVGPAKRGKTFLMLETAKIAQIHGLNVVFYSFEMTKSQNITRLYQNYLGELEKPPRNEDSYEMIQIPYFEENDSGMLEIKQKFVKKRGLTNARIKKKSQSLKQTLKGKIKILCRPQNSMTVDDISRSIDYLALYEDFIPDVIVVDYADIVASNKKLDYRHQLDDVWKGLKALSQSKHCLVVTGSHSNKKTNTKDTSNSDFSEDVRKANHVNIAVAINQKEDEKRLGVFRLSCILHRHKKYLNDNIVVLQNLEIGKPLLGSAHPSKVIGYNNTDSDKKNKRRV